MRIETLIAEAEVAPEFDLAQFERLTKMARAESAQAAALARALRITNQARLHPITAGNRAAEAQPVRTPDDDAAAVLALVGKR